MFARLPLLLSILMLLIYSYPAYGQADELIQLNTENHICGTSLLESIFGIEFSLQKDTSVYQQPDRSFQQTGDKRTFKVFNFEESSGINQVYDEIEFELFAINNLSEVWVEVDEIGPGKINQQVVDFVTEALENSTPERSIDPERGIIDINLDIFGNPPNKQGTGRVKILLVNIRDGWTPETGGGFIAGFFNPVDQSSVDPNSNRADIVYIDTYPGIYLDNQEADPERPLNVLAHEHQHLIHANYGSLNRFQNEGQSELAEIMTGFNKRPMRFLVDPNEISGNVEGGGRRGLYRWRGTDINAVLLDYQRAQLFHSYVWERTGPHNAGRITRGNSGKSGYESALADSTIAWENFLSDFYITNWINNITIHGGIYGYSIPQFFDLRASGAIRVFTPNTGFEVSNEELSLAYGSGGYIVWQQVQDLEINLSENDGIRYYAIIEEPFLTVVEPIPPGQKKFTGSFESITLVPVNISGTFLNEEDGDRSFTYSSTGQTATFEEIPQIFTLRQNFPNPFNPSTTIQYRLREPSKITIEIFTSDGRFVKTLADETRNPGSYDVLFQADGLASGIYFYRFTARSPETGSLIRSEVKPMTLLK